MADIPEILGGIVLFAAGTYFIREISQALQIEWGSLFVGLFIVLGVAWFLKEVFGK